MQARSSRLTAMIAATVLASGCASGGGAVMEGAGTTAPPAGAGQNVSTATQPWGIGTRYHVDLWLHGFAMLTSDTTLVPWFRRGYRTDMQALRTRSNAVTQLDANRERLTSRFAVNRELVNAQFLGMQFATFDQLNQAANIFLQAEGDIRAAHSMEVAQVIQLFGGYFPTGGDRDWLRLFIQSLRDEDAKFYRSHWNAQQTERAAALAAVNDIWQNTYRPKMQQFLNNTGQPNGTVLLSLPLNGEGRSLPQGKLRNAIAVTFPATAATAVEAVYVIAHEVVGSSLASTAVNDNVTPTDRRAGLADRYQSAAAVRGGAFLLQRVAPELVDGYARYYLRSANRTVGTNPVSSLAAAFPLPEAIRDAMTRQLDVILGGI